MCYALIFLISFYHHATLPQSASGGPSHVSLKICFSSAGSAVWWHKQLQCQIFLFLFGRFQPGFKTSATWCIMRYLWIYRWEPHKVFKSRPFRGSASHRSSKETKFSLPSFLKKNLFMYALFLLEDHSSLSHIPPANAEWIQTVLMMGHKTYYQYMENSYFPLLMMLRLEEFQYLKKKKKVK